jgi:hypothetical protein
MKLSTGTQTLTSSLNADEYIASSGYISEMVRRQSERAGQLRKDIAAEKHIRSAGRAVIELLGPAAETRRE